MKFLPNFEGVRRTPFYVPIFLTKDVLYLLSHSSILNAFKDADDLKHIT